MPPKITLSRGLKDRRKLAEVLRQVFGALSEEIAARRDEVLGPVLRPGETMPDAELEHELYLRLLDRRLDEATQAEKSYRTAAIRLKVLNRDRDEATAELKRQVGGVRQLIELARGKGSSAELLKTKGRTERRQTGIFFQATHILSCLSALKPAEPGLDGVAADPAVWIGMIRPPYDRLRKLRKMVLKQEKRLDALLIVKKKAFAAFDDVARGLVHIAEGQCRMVGRMDLAKRIRRFSRKRRKPGPKPKKKAAKAKTAKRKTAAAADEAEPEAEEPAWRRRLRSKTPQVA